MSSLLYVLFSFSGRIGRKDFWVGLGIIVAAAIFGPIILQPDYFSYDVDSDSYPPASLSVNIFNLFMMFPSLAITIKRLNDRDWSRWVVLPIIAIWLPVYIGPFFGLFWEIDTGSSLEMVWWSVVGILSILLLIDNGFLRGTIGANRYGSDPLAN